MLQPPCNPTNGLSGYRKWMDSKKDLKKRIEKEGIITNM